MHNIPSAKKSGENSSYPDTAPTNVQTFNAFKHLSPDCMFVGQMHNSNMEENIHIHLIVFAIYTH